jgi:guanylate kinase
MQGNLYIIWSPSGGGKTTLVTALAVQDPQVRRSVSHTTRAPRTGEEDGREYHFVDRATFQRMVDNGEFLEHAEVYGNHYGTSQRWIEETLGAGQDVFLTIDWQGGVQVRERFPHLIGVYVLPPSLAVLEQRLGARGQDSADVVAERLAQATDDLSHLIEFDYVIINDNFEAAVADLSAIVRAERLKRDRQLLRHQALVQNLTQGK